MSLDFSTQASVAQLRLGLIGLTLATKPGGQFTRFVKALAEVIQSSIHIVDAIPLPVTHEWSRRRDAVIRLHLPFESQQAADLHLLLTGNLADETIDWYMPSGATQLQQREYAWELADALLPKHFEVFFQDEVAGIDHILAAGIPSLLRAQFVAPCHPRLVRYGRAASSIVTSST